MSGRPALPRGRRAHRRAARRDRGAVPRRLHGRLEQPVPLVHHPVTEGVRHPAARLRPDALPGAASTTAGRTTCASPSWVLPSGQGGWTLAPRFRIWRDAGRSVVSGTTGTAYAGDPVVDSAVSGAGDQAGHVDLDARRELRVTGTLSTSRGPVTTTVTRTSRQHVEALVDRRRGRRHAHGVVDRHPGGGDRARERGPRPSNAPSTAGTRTVSSASTRAATSPARTTSRATRHHVVARRRR